MSKTAKRKTSYPRVPGVFIDPLTDFGFKRLFKDKELLIDFLNQALPDVHIETVEYDDKELLGDRETDRRAILDLLCRTDKGEQVMIEMQRAMQPYFADRALFYGAHLIRNQGKQGEEWKYSLNAVHVVAVLDFALKEGTDSVIDRIALMNTRTKEIFSKKLSFTFIQLKNFTKSADELADNFDEWLYCLKHLYHLTSRPASVRGEVFSKLFDLMQTNQLNEEDMRQYKQSILEYSDIRDAISHHEARAKAWGIEQGIAIGEERGITIGMRKIIKSLLAGGMGLQQVSNLIGVPIDDIIHLINTKD
jgi:predicted transposase/invertase (TIGR01784 family)